MSTSHAKRTHGSLDIQLVIAAMRRDFFFVLLLACSALAWANTPSKETCQKLSTSHKGWEYQPSYQLRCERAADGNTQVQLLIDGEKPLVLAGVEKESLAAEDMIFDPASVSVRLLEGQPNLYWIRYGHRRSSEAGGDNIDHQHDWVVQKSDMARTLFDKWT